MASPGAGSQGPSLITVNNKQIELVMDYVENDPFFYAAVNKINNGVFMGGVSVKIENFGKEQQIPEESQKSFRQNFGSAGRRANHLGFSVGYYLLIPVPNPDRRGEYILNVMDPRDFDVQILFLDNLAVQYFISIHDRPMAAMVSLGELLEKSGQISRSEKKRPEGSAYEQIYALQVQDNQTNHGWPLMGGGTSHLFYVTHPPTRKGFLQSPACFLRPERLNVRFMMQDQAYASYWMAHPLHVFNVTKDFRPGGAGAAGGTTGREVQYSVGQFAQADTLGQYKEFSFQRRAHEEASLLVAQEFARNQREYNSKHAGTLMSSLLGSTRPTVRSDGTNPHSMMSPVESYQIIPPLNQTIAAGPPSQAYGGVEKLNQIVTDLAHAIL